MTAPQDSVKRSRSGVHSFNHPPTSHVSLVSLLDYLYLFVPAALLAPHYKHPQTGTESAMCGISCVLSLSANHHHNTTNLPNGNHSEAAASGSRREHLEKELKASLEQIRHRGPDAAGTWTSDDCRVGTLVHTSLISASMLI